jgi:hypothetical protein
MIGTRRAFTKRAAAAAVARVDTAAVYGLRSIRTMRNVTSSEWTDRDIACATFEPTWRRL